VASPETMAPCTLLVMLWIVRPASLMENWTLEPPTTTAGNVGLAVCLPVLIGLALARGVDAI